ncbi:MAG: hypothetical protein Q7T56_20440 [Nocardioidaceae bacterium]|nr:hypothetical protein [Nocardioidaceae bacterium]
MSTSQDLPGGPPPTPPLPGTGRRRVVVALVAALVVVVVAAAAIVAVLSSDDGDPRAEVTAAARAFGVQMNTYDSTDPDEFLDRTAPFLAADYRDDFAALVTPLLTSLSQVRQTSDQARVDDVRLFAVEEARARAELTVSSRVSLAGQPTAERVVQVWQVQLRRSGDRWLVDAFAFGGGGGGSPAPDDGPTDDA